MLPHGALSLISLFGFLTGIILYGMLLWMVLSSRPVSNRLVLLTGVFGLTWNLGSFAAYAVAGVKVNQPVPSLLAISFGALSFLPAAVVHSAVRNSEGWAHPWSRVVVRVAYVMSGTATLVHFYSAIAMGAAPSQLALRGLTVGFGVLLLVLLFGARGQDGWARGLWVAALAVFAVSALHLSAEHGTEDPWWLALLGHHASLPLALAILYQDYKFALADLFLKRALSLILLVGLVFGVYTFGAAPLLDSTRPSEVSILLLLGMWTATALAYPGLQYGAGWFVDKVVLRRGNYGQMLTHAANAIESCDSEAAVLTKAASLLEPALSSRSITWVEGVPGKTHNCTQLPVPTTEAPHFVFVIGPLSGGRRLLSDDHAMIERVALFVGRRIDSLRSTRERYERNLREEEVRKLAAEAELRALRAQINPHFLFNALTTIGHLIQVSPKKALKTLLTLSGLLRSVLKSSGEFVTLGEELSVVEAYLDIERARFEDRLHVSIDVPEGARGLRIPALILQPLVENAIKHGIGRSILGGTVRIAARVEDVLILTVIDTGTGDDLGPSFKNSGRHGVGLENVQRRLACHGGADASLSVGIERGRGTVVEIRYPLEIPVPAGGAPVREKIRIVIADDERPARSFLAATLRTFDDVQIVGEAANGIEAVKVIESHRPDLALLDLQMPEVDGLGVVSLLKKNRMPLIAFVTAYDEYAVSAFELNAVDYVLKPVDPARLRKTLDRVRERLNREDSRDEESRHVRSAAALLESSSPPLPLERIPVRRRDGIVLVPVLQIASVVADGELLHIRTLSNESYTINYRLRDLEARIDRSRFVRLGRGTIVSIANIRKIVPMPGGTFTVFLPNNQQFSVSRIQSRILREQMLKL